MNKGLIFGLTTGDLVVQETDLTIEDFTEKMLKDNQIIGVTLVNATVSKTASIDLDYFHKAKTRIYIPLERIAFIEEWNLEGSDTSEYSI